MEYIKLHPIYTHQCDIFHKLNDVIDYLGGWELEDFNVTQVSL